MKINDDIVICFITDDNYVMPTCVAITSMIMNKKYNSKYIVNIITVDVTEENKYILKKFIDENLKKDVEIKIITKTNEYEYINSEHPYVTKSALLKFNIAEILIDYDKCIYLDSDIIILDDLEELFDIDIENYYAAAVKDYIATEIELDHNILGINNYFNSGVMLLNLSALRRNKVLNLLIDYKINKDRCHFMDQDAFNYCFNNKVKFIGLKYNYMITNVVYDSDVLSRFYGCNIHDKIVILHITNLKPWNNNVEDKKYYYEFWKYYQYTNYFKENPIWAINKISEQKVKKLELQYNERIKNIESYYNTRIDNIINDYDIKINNIINDFNKYKEILYDVKNMAHNCNNWIKLFGIYNNSSYIYIYFFGIRFKVKITEKYINKIAWWIPVKKWRDSFRSKFKIRYD
ncbi:glycosyltransferase family 8 protein [Brachyspira pilosicoli]|uniref:glycosyltransferase family 8 protein n=1 Tax=Brachyspira pilosicoli TaxID=52584 RepID=UPI00254348B9|nr:glycosyltransferase family 8 protein [Brachyspira pilosicoli]WIH87727.1 glycosyltransferase family 8 protein [Brachyspira pilosicoli]